ncbi:hypothetical protein EIP91_011413 [Steccherinum ochraceum]|uniref:Uncharacterized protein n=1 Tax=Steccherinum ochraceum TaxID=92696 RepID=A0A4R0QZQ7_9APHY|nr:hypothetical protein EIP91_011413 [Steccherinum ochraceum]
MRFPKLYNFFKRSKSDTALAALRRTARPNHDVPRRPVSSSFFDQILPDVSRQSSELSAVLSSVPVDPVTLTRTTKSNPVPATAALSNARSKSDPTTPGSLIASLTERIHDLEDTLQAQAREKESLVASLEQALQVERDTVKEYRENNAHLTVDISKLQSDVMEARGELYTVLNYHLRFSTGTESERNRALLQENDRLRRFTKLVVSCGAHTSILERASLRLDQGYDPEESIVNSVKLALQDSNSIWTRLLDPLIGARSPQDYQAQTKCTLVARRESRDWQKKARFWKDTARQEGRHVDTVTPSVSQLSDVVADVPPERKAILDDMLVKLREGSLPLTVEPRTTIRMSLPDTATRSGRPTSPAFDTKTLAGSEPPPTALTTIVESASESDSDDTNISDPFQVPTLSTTLNGPTESHSSCTLHPDMPLTSTTLAPLASITFRESHSIKSVSSTSRRRRSRKLTPSSSMSSQDSRISRLSDRKAKVLAASRSMMEEEEKLKEGEEKREEEERLKAEEGASASSTSGDELAKMLEDAVVAENLLMDDAPPPVLPPPKSPSTPPPAQVTKLPSLVQLASPPSPPFAAAEAVVRTPPRKAPPSNTTPSSSRSIPQTPSTPSPDTKKSKLPVLKLASSVPRSFKRLSISRPILVDTTNAAVVPKSGIKGVSGNGAQSGKEDKIRAVPTVKSKLQMMSPKTRSKMRMVAGTGVRA